MLGEDAVVERIQAHEVAHLVRRLVDVAVVADAGDEAGLGLGFAQVGEFRQPGLARHGQGEEFRVVVDALDEEHRVVGELLAQGLAAFARDVGRIQDGDVAVRGKEGLGLGEVDGRDAFAKRHRLGVGRVVEAGVGGVAGDHAPAHVPVVENADLDVVFFQVFLDLGGDGGLAHGRQTHHGDVELARPGHANILSLARGCCGYRFYYWRIVTVSTKNGDVFFMGGGVSFASHGKDVAIFNKTHDPKRLPS
ncbi:hypothetical protein DSECCO2_604040 [anaerobic digester metagenome]